MEIEVLYANDYYIKNYCIIKMNVIDEDEGKIR